MNEAETAIGRLGGQLLQTEGTANANVPGGSKPAMVEQRQRNQCAESVRGLAPKDRRAFSPESPPESKPSAVTTAAHHRNYKLRPLHHGQKGRGCPA